MILFQAPSQMVCSPGTAFDRSFSDSVNGIGAKSRLRSESNNDFFKPSLELVPHKTTQSLEEPMTPSVVISFEAETNKKSRPQSLLSLSDYPCATTVTMGQRHTALQRGRLNWSEQSRDSCSSTTSLHRAFEVNAGNRVSGGNGVGFCGGGLHLPQARSAHGRSMNSLHRLGGHPSHLSSTASSVTSCRGFGTHRRLMATHHRQLAESTLRLWQQKPQNFVFIGGAKGRRKSLSVTSLRFNKTDFV